MSKKDDGCMTIFIAVVSLFVGCSAQTDADRAKQLVAELETRVHALELRTK